MLNNLSLVSIDSVITSKYVLTPKLAIAPIPKVPITPAFFANSVFLPLEPALQKLFLITSSLIPIPLSDIVIILSIIIISITPSFSEDHSLCK